jgi:hypothetical protein
MRVIACLIACTMAASIAQPVQSQPGPGNVAARLQELEDREAIRLVLRDYGRLLDARQFDEFGQLFAADGEYQSGTVTRGPAQIAASLRKIMTDNPLGFATPNFHVLFNERIEIQGKTAHATSQSFFVVPGPDGSPSIAMMASYDDQLVKTAAGWRFARRVVHGDLSTRRSATTPR